MTKRRTSLLPQVVSMFALVAGCSGFICSSSESWPAAATAATGRTVLPNPPTRTTCFDLPVGLPWRLSATTGSDIIDAEFVRDDEQRSNSGGTSVSTTVADIVLDAAPEWKDIVVEFVSKTPSGNLHVIPCRMPFTVNVDGEVYSIGMPFEDAVAVLEDDANGQLSSLVDPDDDANEEVFQLAATALTENMGNELRLRRTPRVLTVQGNLKSITGTYLQEKQAEPVQAKDLIKDEEDDDDAFFDSFFRKELGENYEDEFAVANDDVDADEVLGLFSVPGLGTEDNEEAIRGLLDEIASDHKAGAGTTDRMVSIANDGAKALPLFPFTSPEGKSYAFVQFKESPLLVGKEDPKIDKTQRLLLNAKESALILPKIEEQLKEELGVLDAGSD
eukprot:CAMPEP_0197723198 /NCGR_PEP_ID=MMETSP1434-20131217/5603_1 /TAXON_ID=265543 /ORGANISM="Minutocellus polymorphus, Strain CCMP3303" /LENGTH=388 /DNA_ID=CAMNT_0043308427 /DNA_START=55 /DNA_END=1221 /DNA_ORIENTATION=+